MTGRRQARTVPDDLLVRPFMMTSGRTAPKHDTLRVETLIRARGDFSPSRLEFESRSIVATCLEPTSVAELSSRLQMPVGVVRVLVSDLVDAQALDVVEHDVVSVYLLERIRDRVRAL